MKRKITIILLAISFIAIILPDTSKVAYAASNSNLAAAYQAYFDFLQDELEKVGRPLTERYPDDAQLQDFIFTGIAYASLLDFDNDGIPELLYGKNARPAEKDIYGDYKYKAVGINLIYKYINGQLVQYSASYGWADNYLTINITKDANGKRYIHSTSTSGADPTGGNSFYGFDSNGFKCVESTWCAFIPDFEITGSIHIQSTTGHYSYAINWSKDGLGGKKVSKAEYDATINRYTCGGTEKLVLETNLDITIAQMKNVIPDYIEKYYYAYNNPSSWAVSLVNEAIDSGVVPQELQRAYNRSINRAEFCALAVAYYESVTGQTISKLESFDDTNDRNICKMAGLGVVTGVGNKKFDPYATLTREQAATILSRLASALGNPIDTATPTFTDNTEISPWASGAVGQMQAANIMGGVGANRFDPKSPYTKEQSIITIKRMDSRLVSATSLTLTIEDTGLTPVSGSDAEALLRVGNSVKIVPHFEPENTTHKTLIWASSNPNVASTGGGGYTVGKQAGTTTITATTKNGISASATIDVRDIVITDKLPLTIECVYHSSSPSSKDFDYLPGDNPRYAGTIQISAVDVDLRSVFPDGVKNLCDITIKGKVSNVRNDLTEFYPYIKWVLRDYDGNIVDKGMKGNYERVGAGDIVTFELRGIKLPDEKGAYSITFYSDEGSTEEDAFLSEPIIQLPDLPFSVTSTGTYIDNSVSTEGLHWTEVTKATTKIIQEHTTIDDIDFQLEYNIRHDNYALHFTCSGSACYTYVHSPFIYWKLLDDETGQSIRNGIFDVSNPNYDKNSVPEDFCFFEEELGSSITIEAGKTYTLTFSNDRF